MARTNIVLDDKLIKELIRITGAKSKREAVDIAMRRIVDQEAMTSKLMRLSGKLSWEGNLGAWRKRRP